LSFSIIEFIIPNQFFDKNTIAVILSDFNVSFKMIHNCDKLFGIIKCLDIVGGLGIFLFGKNPIIDIELGNLTSDNKECIIEFGFGYNIISDIKCPHIKSPQYETSFLLRNYIIM
jgi:hypothetical protein